MYTNYIVKKYLIFENVTIGGVAYIVGDVINLTMDFFLSTWQEVFQIFVDGVKAINLELTDGTIIVAADVDKVEYNHYIYTNTYEYINKYGTFIINNPVVISDGGNRINPNQLLYYDQNKDLVELSIDALKILLTTGNTSLVTKKILEFKPPHKKLTADKLYEFTVDVAGAKLNDAVIINMNTPMFEKMDSEYAEFMSWGTVSSDDRVDIEFKMSKDTVIGINDRLIITVI